MVVKEIGDPRLQALFGVPDLSEASVRPTVRLPGKGLPPVVFAIGILAFAAILFAVLNARRTSEAQAPDPALSAASTTIGWDVPALYIPPAPQPVRPPIAPQMPAPPAPIVLPPPNAAVRSAPPQILYSPAPLPQLTPATVPNPPQRVSSGAPLVIDTGAAPSDAPLTGALTSGMATGPIARMRASALANRSTTVPQGYLIQAVLETGFDSTKPGFARAVVSRNVRGFDGQNVLIPRGSRLIGEYESVTAQGEHRAVIIWTRLIRPDGMTISLNSPVVDTLGRSGVRASVNNHFFARLGDALLQSTVDLGRTVAGRSTTSPVVVVSGSTAAAAVPASSSGGIAPTLTVAPGKSISVFVAHDLDFSAGGSKK